MPIAPDIILTNTPPDYSSAHSDIIFTAYQVDDVTRALPNYKYICDVYIGTAMFRLKALPKPSNGEGVFNIGHIVRSYLAMQFAPGDSSFLAQTIGNGNFYHNVQCKFGEEHEYTMYPNVLVDEVRTYYNYYTGRRVDNTSLIEQFVGKRLSNSPQRFYTLTGNPFLFLPYFNDSATELDINIKAYSANGLDSDLDVDLDNEDIDFDTTQAVVPGSLLQFNLAPHIIADMLPTPLGDRWRYVIEINGEPFADVSIECENTYIPYTLHFMNQYGGFESFDFRKVSRKTIDLEKKDFTQLPYRVGASVAYNYGNVANHTKTVYASQYTEKLKLTSDHVTDEQYRWLKELVISPIVYLQEGNKLVPVTIVSNNYEERQYVNDRLTSLILDLDFGQTLNAQYQ